MTVLAASVNAFSEGYVLDVAGGRCKRRKIRGPVPWEPWVPRKESYDERFFSIARSISRGIASRLGADFSQSESDAMLGLVESLNTWEPRRGVPLEAWVRMNVKWKVMGEYRKMLIGRRRLPQIEADDSRLPGPPLAPSYLKEVLTRLTPRQAIVSVAAACGYTDTEIADLLGVSSKTVNHVRGDVRFKLERNP